MAPNHLGNNFRPQGNFNAVGGGAKLGGAAQPPGRGRLRGEQGFRPPATRGHSGARRRRGRVGLRRAAGLGGGAGHHLGGGYPGGLGGGYGGGPVGGARRRPCRHVGGATAAAVVAIAAATSGASRAAGTWAASARRPCRGISGGHAGGGGGRGRRPPLTRPGFDRTRTNAGRPVEDSSRPAGSFVGSRAIGPQWRKWRRPVKTMARSCSSQASTVSSSRFDPPGWIRAVTPARAASSGPSRNGKKASEARTAPRASVAGLRRRRSGPSRADSSARRPRRRVAAPGPGRSRSTSPPGRPARRTQSEPFVGGGRPLRGHGPGGGVGSIVSQSWTSRPPSTRRRSKPRGGGESGPIADSEGHQADAVLPGGLGGEEPEGVRVEARGDDGLDEPARLAQALGGGEVDRAVHAHDPAEGTDGIALVGQLEGLGQRRRPRRHRTGCCA